MSIVTDFLRRRGQQLLFIVMTGLVLGYVARHGREILLDLRKAAVSDLPLLLVAFGLQPLYHPVIAEGYRRSLLAVGVRRRLRLVLALLLGSLSVNVLVPAALGLGGAGLFLQDARRRGDGATGTGVGIVLAAALEAATFAAGIAALTVLVTRGSGFPPQLIGPLLGMFILVGGLLAFLSGLLRGHGRLEGLARRMESRFPRAAATLRRAAGTLVKIRVDTRQAGLACAWFLFGHALNFFALAAVFTAFGARFGLPGYALLYAVTGILSFIAPTPQGVGVVEGAASLTAARLGLPLETAVAATVTYRVFTFWLPLVVGVGALRMTVLRRRTGGQAPVTF